MRFYCIYSSQDTLIPTVNTFDLVKGKLAHNFMISYIVLISCLSHMVRTYIMKGKCKD